MNRKSRLYEASANNTQFWWTAVAQSLGCFPALACAVTAGETDTPSLARVPCRPAIVGRCSSICSAGLVARVHNIS